MATNTDPAVHAAHDAYLNAINSNNLDNFLASITDDIVYLPANSAAIVGKGEVGPWVQGYFEAFHTQWVKTTIEFVVEGDLAYEWYTYQVSDTRGTAATSRPTAATASTSTAKALTPPGASLVTCGPPHRSSAPPRWTRSDATRCRSPSAGENAGDADRFTTEPNDQPK